MKRLLLAGTALMVAMTGTVASAQDRYQGRDDRGTYSRDQRGEDRNYRQDRRDDRRGYNDRRDDRGHQRYARGQRYRGDGAYVANYSRYGYRAPPRGYRYYRTNQGDVILAAVATGIIASVIAGNSRY